MSVIEDGGPAFPVWELNGGGQPEMTHFGMSLRDYFAAKAMPACIEDYCHEARERGWDRRDGCLPHG
jgi:hypothetical protein